MNDTVQQKILKMYQAWSCDRGLVRRDFITMVMEEFDCNRTVATNMSSFLNEHIMKGNENGER